MKIELEYPYNTKYKFGYLVTNPENRRNVILFNSTKDRSTVSYARYLMSVKEQRFLDSTEEVDHDNEDKTDDRIENLKIMSKAENMRKNLEARGIKETFFDFVCPVCSKEFKLSKQRSYKKVNPCCSRKCGYEKRKVA